MCGLFGFAGRTKDAPTLSRFLRVLAIETSERGTDATGFAALCEGGRLVTSKAPVPASQFVFRDAAFATLFEHSPTLMVGHCRLATHGDKANNVNNHPHIAKDGSLAIVHNGVVWDHAKLAQRHDFKLRGDCDSEAILKLAELAIPANEPKPYDKLVDMTQTLEDFDAMFSVLVLDRSRRCIWSLRNFSNPLVYWKSDVLGVTIFASELSHIHNAARVVLGKKTPASINAYSPNPGTVFRFRENGAVTNSRRSATCVAASQRWARGMSRGSYASDMADFYGVTGTPKVGDVSTERALWSPTKDGKFLRTSWEDERTWADDLPHSNQCVCKHRAECIARRDEYKKRATQRRDAVASARSAEKGASK